MSKAEKLDDGQVWLGGPFEGQPTKKQPTSYKMWREDAPPPPAYAAEDAKPQLTGQQLVSYAQLDVLARRKAYFAELSKRAACDHSIAEMIQQDPKLLGDQRKPPPRWPIYALVAVQAILLALVTVALYTRPTLPSQDHEGDSAGVRAPERARAVVQKGRLGPEVAK